MPYKKPSIVNETASFICIVSCAAQPLQRDASMNASSLFTTSTNTTINSSVKISKPQPLFPGCRHVETFSDDGDYEDGGQEDEETRDESYVTLDLGSVDQTLVPSSSTYRMIVSCIPRLGCRICVDMRSNDAGT